MELKLGFAAKVGFFGNCWLISWEMFGENPAFCARCQRRRVSSRWSVDISDFISEGVMVSSADDAPLLRLRRNTHHSSLSVMRLQVMTRLVEKSISCSMVMLSNTETGEAVAVRLLVVASFFDILLTLKKKNASSYPLSNGLANHAATITATARGKKRTISFILNAASILDNANVGRIFGMCKFFWGKLRKKIRGGWNPPGMD